MGVGGQKTCLLGSGGTSGRREQGRDPSGFIGIEKIIAIVTLTSCQNKIFAIERERGQAIRHHQAIHVVVAGRRIAAIGIVFGINSWITEAHHGESITAGALAAEVVVVVDDNGAVVPQGEALGLVVAERAAHRRQVEQLHLAGQLDAGGSQTIGARGVVDTIHQGEAVVEQLGAGHADRVQPARGGSASSFGRNHHTELAQLHLAGGGANTLVDLISDQEIAKLAGVVAADASEVAADINDAGGFLVIGDEVGVRGARAPEQDRIVLRQLHQRVGGGVVTPDLRQAGVAAGIFLQQDRAVIGHGHVVEHHLALAAVEQHLHRTAELRTGGVRELQRPQPAGACGRGRGDEIEALAVLAPGPIFRPQPVGHTGGNALAVQRGAGFTLDITQIHQLKAADAAAIQSQARFIRARQVAQLGVGGTSGVDANAIGGATG